MTTKNENDGGTRSDAASGGADGSDDYVAELSGGEDNSHVRAINL